MTVRLCLIGLCWLGILWSTHAGAADANNESRADWLTPVIDYGAVQALPDAAVQLDPKARYKVLFNVTKPASRPTDVVPGLERVARFLNLAALAKVPAGNPELVAVVHGKATQGLLNNLVYRERFGVSNPNAGLMSQLKERGVTLYVCGQALAHQHLAANQLLTEVQVAVAALSVLAEYQTNGYALIPD